MRGRERLTDQDGRYDGEREFRAMRLQTLGDGEWTRKDMEWRKRMQAILGERHTEEGGV